MTTHAVQEGSSNAHADRAETMSSGIVIPDSGEITIPSYGVLGVRVHPLQVPDILLVLDHWIQERRCVHCVCSTGMHGATESLWNPKFKEILNRVDLNNMDGVPMKLLARIHGFKYAKRRSPGPEVMGALLSETGPKYKHFFYGNRVSEELARLCAKKYGTRVVGIYSSPIWPLPEVEKQNITKAIESVAPDIVWCALGTMRQEPWMDEFRYRLTVPVLYGVGAAFDFHAGKLKRAPVWMRETGLEWFYRLMHEPTRLWRRYLVYGSIFLWNVGLELTGLKKFD
jgi:N-acetylglucosaminyldiphosphoundecaprenol N-acetyl-beta-D-mannosaminyltransferase